MIKILNTNILFVQIFKCIVGIVKIDKQMNKYFPCLLLLVQSLSKCTSRENSSSIEMSLYYGYSNSPSNVEQTVHMIQRHT